MYLSDHFHDVPVKIYFRNLFDSTLSYFQESSLDISLFSYNDSNDCQSIFFDFTTFAFPFSESFCSKLSKYFEFDLPYFLDSNKNQFVSVSTLYKLLAGVDEIEFASIIEFATQLYPIELSQTSSLGSRLVKYIVESDYPSYPTRLVDFTKSTIAASAPLAAIKVGVQTAIIYPDIPNPPPSEYDFTEYKSNLKNFYHICLPSS